MPTPRYFNRSKIISILVCTCGLFSLLTFVAWLARYYAHIEIDWSFVLPTITLISGLVPIGSAVVNWFEKKLKPINETLDKLELSEMSFKEAVKHSEADRYDLRGRLLKLEIRLEALIDRKQC